MNSNERKALLDQVMQIAERDKRFHMLEAFMKRPFHRADALIEVLHKAQELFGYLDDHCLFYVAHRLKVPPSRVYGVASFYSFFRLKPPGRHSCVVCTGTGCFLQGADRLLEAIRNRLRIEVGETTADGTVSLFTARCMGACGTGPTVAYDRAIESRQTPETALARMDEWLPQSRFLPAAAIDEKAKPAAGRVWA